MFPLGLSDSSLRAIIIFKQSITDWWMLEFAFKWQLQGRFVLLSSKCEPTVLIAGLKFTEAHLGRTNVRKHFLVSKIESTGTVCPWRDVEPP